MPTYVIGDIHGCWRTLERLLERIRWRQERDRLWLVGDLVNRGPESLAVLRWAVAQPGLVVTLGNHDLHLLAVAAGLARRRSEDRLEEVLGAPDRDELLGWLRTRPFVHRENGVMMVHAGLWPGWDLAHAEAMASEAQQRLAGRGRRAFLERLVSKPRPKWRTDLVGDERLAAAAAIFTRLRVVGRDGRVKLGFTGPPEEAPEGYRPWFETSDIVKRGPRLVFGHWAQLGFFRDDRVVCLDSGCVYGGTLTALRLEDGQVFHEPVADSAAPMEE
jgi:bis(5'-nucleosyl)-tetraphosphatase (symmetrical)